MARPLRDNRVPPLASGISAPSAEPLLAAVRSDYRLGVGGPVGWLQADIASRLAGGLGGADVVLAPNERLVRFVSVAGGYVALVGAYVGVAMLFLR